jgi:Protein of unknown function (DUF3891)
LELPLNLNVGNVGNLGNVGNDRPVIIRHAKDQLHLITQGDHAALAGRIMRAWTLGGLPDHPQRDLILSATDDHDNGWREEDAELHVSEAGDPLDFVAVPAYVKQRIWPRGTDRWAARSPYVAALIAQHALTVYATLAEDPAWAGFFRLMTRTRDELIARSGVGPHDLAGDYPFVRTGDQLSLIFCNGWDAPLTGIGYKAILSGTTLQITPDPFAGARVPLAVTARSLPATRYGSAADLRAAIAAAPTVRLAGEAVGV